MIGAFVLLAGAVAATPPAPPVVIITTPVPPPAAPAPDPARVRAARELLDTIMPPATRDATFAQMINAMMANMTRGIIQGQRLDQVFAAHPDAGQVFARFVERQRELAVADLKAAMPAMLDAQAEAYARRFTVEEMAAIRAFYASPVGRKYREQSVTIMSDPAIARWQTDLASRTQARLTGEIAKFLAELKPILDRDAAEAPARPS